jgi:hypothetical protein
LPSPTLSTANELALSKAILRQHRGGEDFAPASSAAEYRARPALDTANSAGRSNRRSGAAAPFALGAGPTPQALTQQSMPNVKQFTLAGGVVFHL